MIREQLSLSCIEHFRLKKKFKVNTTSTYSNTIRVN